MTRLPPDSRPAISLSPRQISCLHLAASGKTSRQIGAALGISARTVNQHIGDACSRLQVHNRIQAVAKAVKLGIIMVEDPSAI
ncbi:MAG: helix-turn-helix transcriptional regulator [Phenylobacterium sp.]|uniref:helix-turn-helix domain-containing protein n=1 Tax=Phenylobacterium sp. TaxID=1871053 RepID=UPI002734D6BD|nr:helix-turn-helix transcriptional regulator [Phenylobacterium sp.]MDP3749527.1 helix-turn-helix transcriptional regulator [Phenylobacterium sp.]